MSSSPVGCPRSTANRGSASLALSPMHRPTKWRWNRGPKRCSCGSGSGCFLCRRVETEPKHKWGEAQVGRARASTGISYGSTTSWTMAAVCASLYVGRPWGMLGRPWRMLGRPWGQGMVGAGCDARRGSPPRVWHRTRVDTLTIPELYCHRLHGVHRGGPARSGAGRGCYVPTVPGSPNACDGRKAKQPASVRAAAPAEDAEESLESTPEKPAQGRWFVSIARYRSRQTVDRIWPRRVGVLAFRGVRPRATLPLSGHPGRRSEPATVPVCSD